MCIIHMRLRCSDKFSEILPEDVERTELIVEDIVSTALLEVFDSVDVENVTVSRPPNGLDHSMFIDLNPYE